MRCIMTGKSNYFDKKVKRLLDEGRVTLDSIGAKFIWFKVRGDTDTYLLSYNKSTYKWTCPCIGKSNYKIDKNVYCTHMEAADIVRVSMKLTGRDEG